MFTKTLGFKSFSTPELRVIYLMSSSCISLFVWTLAGLRLLLWCSTQIHLSSCLFSSPHVVFTFWVWYLACGACVFPRPVFWTHHHYLSFHLGDGGSCSGVIIGCGSGDWFFFFFLFFLSHIAQTSISPWLDRCSLSVNGVIPLCFNSIWTSFCHICHILSAWSL